MTDKHHLLLGATSLAAVYSRYVLIEHQSFTTKTYEIAGNISTFLMQTNMPVFLYIPLCLFLYFLGTALPDVDYPYSGIGKIFYLPIGHKTWLHCWLPLLICCISGIFCRPVFWLGIGIFTHLFYDSFSLSGTPWAYPVPIKHVFKVYHTSHLSEYVFVFFVFSISVAYCIFNFQQVYHFFG